MKQSRFFFLALIVALPFIAFTQDDKIQLKAQDAAFGTSDLEMIDRLMYTVPGIGRDPRDIIERQSIKPYMMPVRKIGPRGSELSYILSSCLEYYVNLNQNYKDNLSPDFLKLNLESTGKRVTPQEAFLFLAEQGTVSASIMPFDSKTIPNAVYATAKYQINNYLHIVRDVMRGRQKVYEVRKALMRGNPVIIELQADASIRSLIRQDTWEPPAKPAELFPLLVVGYDETREAFEVSGCWGSSWGNSGYLWIRYDDFENYVMNGYVMVPQAVY
ncbi:MAG: hypothetical protein KDD19_26525 [Phaeodactylibacter sp.]|nr:hypothetical protein [Phaeodactylibacter sp.]MCB9052464.1 hypothetical protein [Lewinellaceae bacterium]